MQLPIISHLHIFQLEGYSIHRFIHWWLRHPLVLKTGHKKPLVYTLKVKQLILISFILYLSSLFLSPIIAFILFIFPFPLIILALFIIKPYEYINRLLTISRSRKAILSSPNLTTIGITGSYGKTSTKNYLHQILYLYKFTLQTPLSFNTTFGIARVIDEELTRKHAFFLCEMGAYVRGEIKDLCFQAPPQFGILTAIGDQHLERFGSLTNTTLAKFELIDAVKPEKALVNLDNQYIKSHLKQSRLRKVKTYSLLDPTANFYVSSITHSNGKSLFTLHYSKHKYQFSTDLFGSSNIQNLTAAIGMSIMLGVPLKLIQYAVSQIQPSEHRLQLRQYNHATLIDNTYSSNTAGFNNILDDLSKLKGKIALITPGIIELGPTSNSVHQQLGERIATIFDKVYLVGQSDRTKYLHQGITSTNPSLPVEYLDDPKDYWPTVDQLSVEYDWILLENDLPDNF